MSILFTRLFLLLSLFSSLFVFSDQLTSEDDSTSSSLYLSRSLFLRNYQKMLQSFKIYIYTPPSQISFNSPELSLFFDSLRKSAFVTPNAEEAHLFFVSFPSDSSTRSIARVIRDLRNTLPYWNRTLGADHFFLSSQGLGYFKDRNLVELKKNSVQISLFPSLNFVPHKDLSLPPFTRLHSPPDSKTTSKKYLFFVARNAVRELTLLNEIRNDVDFLMESESSEEISLAERLLSSKFCLFEYGGDVSSFGEATRLGCVPVIVTNRPIHDMPLMDVLRWQELAVFVGPEVGVNEIKRVVSTWDGKRSMGTVGKHFEWNSEAQPYDSFNMVMYQLWLRRHTIRYARIDSV